MLRECKEIVPHLHLSIQSASERILNRMGRSHYSPDNILDFIDKLRAIWPVFGLGCDVLVGFPGEDDEDFMATYNFCKKKWPLPMAMYLSTQKDQALLQPNTKIKS